MPHIMGQEPTKSTTTTVAHPSNLLAAYIYIIKMVRKHKLTATPSFDMLLPHQTLIDIKTYRPHSQGGTVDVPTVIERIWVPMGWRERGAARKWRESEFFRLRKRYIKYLGEKLLALTREAEDYTIDKNSDLVKATALMHEAAALIQKAAEEPRKTMADVIQG